jgi:hypothetical protein
VKAQESGGIEVLPRTKIAGGHGAVSGSRENKLPAEALVLAQLQDEAAARRLRTARQAVRHARKVLKDCRREARRTRKLASAAHKAWKKMRKRARAAGIKTLDSRSRAATRRGARTIKHRPARHAVGQTRAHVTRKETGRASPASRTRARQQASGTPQVTPRPRKAAAPPRRSAVTPPASRKRVRTRAAPSSPARAKRPAKAHATSVRHPVESRRARPAVLPGGGLPAARTRH